MLQAGKAPPTWGQASSLLNDFYTSSLLANPELEFLRFCHSGWKLESWTTFNYPSWAAGCGLTTSDEEGKKKKKGRTTSTNDNGGEPTASSTDSDLSIAGAGIEIGSTSDLEANRRQYTPLNFQDPLYVIILTSILSESLM